MKAALRAIGVVRVSQVAGREGESFHSPTEQRDRIEEACTRDSLQLVETHEELDVSGGTPLEQRPGLSLAVEAIESGRADVVMVAYFDRLVRSLRVQDEVVSRVEAAGGRVVALDFGDVTGATAAQWLSGTAIGMVSEYHRRSARERNGAAQAKAVAAGIAPFNNIPPGYIRGPDKVLVPDPEIAPLVVEAFTMRAGGSPIKPIRAFLRENGIERSHHGIESMLSSRIYLGEIHFGKLVNLDAHEPIVDRDLWQAVQNMKVPRGRRAKSDRLLARLGVLRCGNCGARMSVGTQRQNGRVYPFYKCNPLGDCPNRMAIGAEIVEGAVVDAVRTKYGEAQGRASAESNARAADVAAEKAQADFDAAIRAFAGIEDETAARDRLAELREIRDKAVDHASHLHSLTASQTLRLLEHPDRLTFDAWRTIVRDAVEVVTVAPGRGPSRLTIRFRE